VRTEEVNVAFWAILLLLSDLIEFDGQNRRERGREGRKETDNGNPQNRGNMHKGGGGGKGKYCNITFSMDFKRRWKEER
jgi:hypothetical protein